MDQKTTQSYWIVSALYFVLLVGCGIFSLYGLLVENPSATSIALVPFTILGFVITAALLPIANTVLKQRHQQETTNRETAEKMTEMLEQIHEHTMLSDSAKRIAYRREERQMLRRAIEEDIELEDWDAATALVSHMSERFGYLEEAEEFRRHIDKRRADVMHRRLRDSIEHCEALTAAREWTAAYAESARIKRMFPDAPQGHDLDLQVRRAWRDHKETLEQQFLDAAGQSDAEQALEHLKELDAYLSPREAEPYKEIARGVIGQARDNLGIQFKLAIRGQEWAHAVRVGERIIDEFPNTLMAREVRERIGVLRVRAAEADGQHLQTPQPVVHSPAAAAATEAISDAAAE